MPTGQPALHDLVTIVHAPDLVLSGSDGQLGSTAPQGWYSGDRRALAQLALEFDNAELDTVGLHHDGASAVYIHSAIRSPAGDPAILLKHCGLDSEGIAASIRARYPQLDAATSVLAPKRSAA